jgi:hypothetical protein
MVLSAGAIHMTWIGDNNVTTAWPLGTYATTESNPFSLVYSGQVDRYIQHMAATTAYNAVDFSNADTQYRNLTIFGSTITSTIIFPSRTTLTVNGDITLGTVTAYPSGASGNLGPRLTLGNAGAGSADAAFDIWLQRGLRDVYGEVAEEPIPPEILSLIENSRNS